MTHQCYKCGFQTNNVGDFMGTQNTSDHYWTMFICPQCSTSNPPVAEVPYEGDRVQPNFKMNGWLVQESADGMRAVVPGSKGGCTIGYMHPRHPLMDAPAAILDPSYTGTIRDHGKRLKAAGDANAKRFHAECQDWEQNNPRGSKKDRIAFVDESRERNQVGPHAPRKNHNGQAVMQAAGFRF